MPDPREADPGTLPRTLRARRQARGWSLRQLAEASGVSPTMLSEVERGAKSPTVRLAYQIARALDCSITELVGDAPNDAPGRQDGGSGVVDGATGHLRDDESGIRRRAFTTPLQHGGLELVVYDLDGRADSGELEPNRPGTIETVAVLSGALELEVDGRVRRIEAGECVGHGRGVVAYRNADPDEPCSFVALVDRTRT